MSGLDISHRYIDRPILAGVLSLFIFIAGAISMFRLPISEYPEVVPPTVNVVAFYPGANPKVIAETVASPLEEQVSGVENMLYMSSQATTDGKMSLTVTFKLGTDPDLAQQLVQNRVSQATPRLPDVVRALGVTVQKSSPDLTMVVHLFSPNERYDMAYLRNYAVINVKDQLARLQGVGQVALFGSGDYAMRLWLDPNKAAARNISASDIIAAVREQNVQVAAGVIGASPSGPDIAFEMPINVQGRLRTVEEFENIIVKSERNAVTRIKDVARVELGASEYALRSLLNNKPAVAIPIFQSPGSNALQVSNDVRALMAQLKQNFPEGVDYSIVYDPTRFVQQSIDAVIHTLFEAIALVVLVVIVFLQTWRASIIPLIAVPISIVGTFAMLHVLGLSINALSLFGLVLAIGIVVDDAIVVVENVERNIESGLSPREATYQAMREVSGPIIAIALVLCAVFVPIGFISGLTGQFYKQFAITIAISTVISAFNSLTLSPALASILLKHHGAKQDWLTRQFTALFGFLFAHIRFVLIGVAVMIVGTLLSFILMKLFPQQMPGPPPTFVIYVLIATKVLSTACFGIAALSALLTLVTRRPLPAEWAGFGRFNQFFLNAAERYGRVVHWSFSNKKRLGLLYIALIALTVFAFGIVRNGYVPTQDKQYLVAFAQLPSGATIDRTDAIIRRMSDIVLKHPGVQNAIAFPGLSIAGFSNSSSAGIVFVGLKPFEERTSPDLQMGAIVGALNQQFAAIDGAFMAIFPPPPVMGLGTIGGFKLEIEDRGDLGYDALAHTVGEIMGRAYQTPVLAQVFSSFQNNVPQVDVEVNRTRALQQDVPLSALFDTLQAYLGSYYINDFNLFGRTFRVYAEADAPFRAHPEQIGQLKVRNREGQMVPLGSLVDIRESYGPDRAQRYNGYRAADLNGNSGPGFSSGDAQIAIIKILNDVLPKGMSYEWTELTYQQIIAGNTAIYVFPMCVLFVFLVLAAQYESLSLPLAVILIVPLCLFGSIYGVWLSGRENNVFTQIGFVVLVGLACKNAILIVEFARELEIQGRSILDAALEASRLRLRPILMTSFAFIMGVLPLVTASGAGAEMRQDMGIAVFSGMLGVTFFGLVLTPMFYVIIRTAAVRITGRREVTHG